MKWKDTDKTCYYVRWSTIDYGISKGINIDPFSDHYWEFYNNSILYENIDLSNVDSFRTKTINPESKLFFDPSSGFPRFKLGLTDNKRCIKTNKANYIVVSGNTAYHLTSEEYVVLEDDLRIYLVDIEDWNVYYGKNINSFVSILAKIGQNLTNIKVIYQGKIRSFTKENLYVAKYALGEYTVPFIIDNDLDKICCNMCPDPTYEEFLSIIDMLNSEDASVVQLGVKTLAAYNIDKYKLSFRMILCTRSNWFLYSKNLVATKQLCETLDLNRYNIYDSFASGCYRIERSNEVYDAEDVAIARQLSSKLIKEDLQNYANNTYFNRDYKWLPDERRIKLE